jgi:hypothetical protein
MPAEPAPTCGLLSSPDPAMPLQNGAWDACQVTGVTQHNLVVVAFA